jgi:hypothetical protein
MTLEEDYKATQAAINNAVIEVNVRRKQLDELRKPKLEYEEECLNTFGVPITELENYIDNKTTEGEGLIQKLKEALENAKP